MATPAAPAPPHYQIYKTLGPVNGEYCLWSTSMYHNLEIAVLAALEERRSLLKEGKSGYLSVKKYHQRKFTEICIIKIGG